VLANGEKVVPGPTEGALLAQGVVTGAILFGRERNQAGVLVEPADVFAFDPTDASDLAAFRNKLWCASGGQSSLIPALREGTGPRSTTPTGCNRHSPEYVRYYRSSIQEILYNGVFTDIQGDGPRHPEGRTSAACWQGHYQSPRGACGIQSRH
jgi:hypothetical protein